MFLQAIETTNSFWGSSLMFWILWLGTFLLASALYWFGYGRRYKDLLEDKEVMIKKLRPQLNILNNEKEHLFEDVWLGNESISHQALKSVQCRFYIF